jgi:hypothetical protein
LRAGKPVSVACKPSLWSLLSPRSGKRFLTARHRKRKTAFDRSFEETGSSLCTRAKSRYSASNGKVGNFSPGRHGRPAGGLESNARSPIFDCRLYSVRCGRTHRPWSHTPRRARVFPRPPRPALQGLFIAHKQLWRDEASRQSLKLLLISSALRSSEFA